MNSPSSRRRHIIFNHNFEIVTRNSPLLYSTHTSNQGSETKGNLLWAAAALCRSYKTRSDFWRDKTRYQEGKRNEKTKQNQRDTIRYDPIRSDTKRYYYTVYCLLSTVCVICAAIYFHFLSNSLINSIKPSIKQASKQSSNRSNK